MTGFIDKSCPGAEGTCNGNGECDHKIGQCICNEGNQGFDCSGDTYLDITICNWYLIRLILTTYVFVELTCPKDCSNAGDCNTSTGLCLCDSGRHGVDCSSKQS